jgi:hypothetical protein
MGLRARLGLSDHADVEPQRASRPSSKCWRKSSPGRTSFPFSTALPTIAAATSPFPTITLLYLPPHSPELNPKENLWDGIREKIFKNYALKSVDAGRAKLRQAIVYIERNPKLVHPSPRFPMSSTHSDVELV